MLDAMLRLQRKLTLFWCEVVPRMLHDVGEDCHSPHDNVCRRRNCVPELFGYTQHNNGQTLVAWTCS